MITLTSATGNVHHAPARETLGADGKVHPGEGTVCNGIGSARGNVRWYVRKGKKVTCKRCIRVIAAQVADAEVEAYAMEAAPAAPVAAPVENVHHVSYTNVSGYSGTVLIEWGTDRRGQALEQAASIRRSGGTVHGIVEITPRGKRIVVTEPEQQAPESAETTGESKPLKPGTPVLVNEHGEASVRGATGVVRPGTTLWTASVELTSPDGRWLGTKRIPTAHLTVRTPDAPAVTVTRTRVAVGTQIAEACAALGIELGHGTDKGLPRYVVQGEKYTTRDLADLVLAGGFDGAYGRAETVVREDSPLAARVTDPAEAEHAAYAELDERDAKATATDHLLPGFTARRAALLRIAEHGGAIAADGLESGMGDTLVRAGLVQRVVGPAPEGFALTAHGRRVADLLAEVEPLEVVPIGHPARLVGPDGAVSGVFEPTRAPATEAETATVLDRNRVVTLVEPEILDMMAAAREITGGRFLGVEPGLSDRDV